MVSISFVIQRAIVQSASLLFGSTGEILTEKSGHLNLGTAGTMYVGGICGVIGAFFYENSVPRGEELNPFLGIAIPLACCIAGSLLMGLIYCFLTVTLRANQNVTGLALTTFGTGIGNFFGGSLVKLVDSDVASVNFSRTSELYKLYIPLADKLGWFGQIFLSHGFLLYLSIIIAAVAAYFLNKTAKGLKLRAVGENPATADAAGIRVNLYKYVATCIGSIVAGLGGLYYVMEVGNWSNDAFGDRGWLAIALVIFAIWRPGLAVVGSILFGGLCIAYLYIPNISASMRELFKMMPYVVTIVVLIATSLRRKRETQPPAHLGMSYFREER